MRTSARLLRLLGLLQLHREWAGADLAARLEVDVRTVRRDVDRLRDLGYPVHSTPGVAGGYRLGAGAALPPLLLDDEEAVAVAVSLSTAAGGTVTGIEETSVRALMKLEQVLPARLRHRVDSLRSVTLPLGGGVSAVDPARLTVIAAACRDTEKLRFAYAAGDGTATERRVEPLKLACTGRRWYLLAWDVDKAAWRTFRVDRITDEPRIAGRFTPREPPAADLGAYLTRQLSSAPYRYQCRVKLHAPASRIAELVGASIGEVEPIDEHTCRLHAGGSRIDEIPFYLARFGCDFEVEDPPELAAHVRELAARFGRAG
ncbi:YafY family protein [Amycolatopsis sp. YIM 10]|uniref:helix-turn-helix transcriptional regulator n=1 Tax=Amycolatopsis sp. YIM 10 TaxID=2653857 RepID=UPI0012904769|nr:YafY family protein [Amycolatopsis sp. YIM 10]QFU88862.1 HTH domain protein [Amycolatopsis sp. YIM 10]